MTCGGRAVLSPRFTLGYQHSCQLRTQQQADEIFTHGRSFLRLYLKLSMASLRLASTFNGMGKISILVTNFSQDWESGICPLQRFDPVCVVIDFLPTTESHDKGHGILLCTHVCLILKLRVDPPSDARRNEQTWGVRPKMHVPWLLLVIVVTLSRSDYKSQIYMDEHIYSIDLFFAPKCIDCCNTTRPCGTYWLRSNTKDICLLFSMFCVFFSVVYKLVITLPNHCLILFLDRLRNLRKQSKILALFCWWG